MQLNKECNCGKVYVIDDAHYGNDGNDEHGNDYAHGVRC